MSLSRTTRSAPAAAAISGSTRAAHDDRDWRCRAACLGLDSELFFPIGTTGPAVSELADAQQVCAHCPVRKDCLDWAIDHHVEHGVWGGLSEEQRRSLRRLSARQRIPVGPA